VYRCWEEAFDAKKEGVRVAAVECEVAKETVYYVVTPGDRFRLWVSVNRSMCWQIGVFLC